MRNKIYKSRTLVDIKDFENILFSTGKEVDLSQNFLSVRMVVNCLFFIL